MPVPLEVGVATTTPRAVWMVPKIDASAPGSPAVDGNEAVAVPLAVPPAGTVSDDGDTATGAMPAAATERVYVTSAPLVLWIVKGSVVEYVPVLIGLYPKSSVSRPAAVVT